MLYQHNLKIQQVTESIIKGIETQNYIIMSELGSLELKSRELVEGISRNIENEVRKLINSMVQSI
jgi:nucleoside-triphosphatase THEP1